MSGACCSRYRTQPGEQEVMRGRVPPPLRRLKNSVPSSRMVKSAAVSTSNTLSKPRRRRAVTILPSTLVPMGRPKHSPRVTRMEGAGPTTTCLAGSFRAASTRAVSSFSERAPVGQATMHWPQETQSTSARSRSKAQPMWVWKPRSLGPMTPTSWVLRHTAVHRRQRTHLELSRTRWGAEASIWGGMLSLAYRTASMPRSPASWSSSQWLLREQVRQSIRWLERISSRVSWRDLRTRSVLV